MFQNNLATARDCVLQSYRAKPPQISVIFLLQIGIFTIVYSYGLVLFSNTPFRVNCERCSSPRYGGPVNFLFVGNPKRFLKLVVVVFTALIIGLGLLVSPAQADSVGEEFDHAVLGNVKIKGEPVGGAVA